MCLEPNPNNEERVPEHCPSVFSKTARVSFENARAISHSDVSIQWHSVKREKCTSMKRREKENLCRTISWIGRSGENQISEKREPRPKNPNQNMSKCGIFLLLSNLIQKQAHNYELFRSTISFGKYSSK